MIKPKLLLFGAGGHCCSVLDCINKNIYEDIGIIDLPEKVGSYFQGIKIIGSDADIIDLFNQGYCQAFITLGSINFIDKRRALYEKLKNIGFYLPSVIASSAIVSNSQTNIAEGVFIGKGVIINAGVSLGDCCIINSGALVEHDCNIGNFVHIAPGANLAGTVKVGDNTFVGIGSNIIQDITLGEDVVIGAGSVVINSIARNSVACGVPCKVIKPKYFN